MAFQSNKHALTHTWRKLNQLGLILWRAIYLWWIDNKSSQRFMRAYPWTTAPDRRVLRSHCLPWPNFFWWPICTFTLPRMGFCKILILRMLVIFAWCKPSRSSGSWPIKGIFMRNGRIYKSEKKCVPSSIKEYTEYLVDSYFLLFIYSWNLI